MADSYLTIVSGLPRSGTSMMMQAIDAGGMEVLIDNFRKADDDNPKGYYEFEAVKRTKEDASWLETAPGKCVKMIYRLLYDLPDTNQYRVIFMRRNIEEVLASQKIMLERRGEKGGALSDEIMAKAFLGQIKQFHDWVAQHPHFSVLEVNYSEMVADPVNQCQRINDFLDGRLDTQKMAQVVDPTLYRNVKQ